MGGSDSRFHDFVSLHSIFGTIWWSCKCMSGPTLARPFSTPKKNEVETKIWSTFFLFVRASAPPSVRPLYVFHFYPCLSLDAGAAPTSSSIHVVHARAASSSSFARLHAGANPCLVGPPRRRLPRLVLRVCRPHRRRPWLLIRVPLLPVLHRNRRPTRSRVSTSPRRRLSSAPSPGRLDKHTCNTPP
jgi:hypothetical protein